MGSGNRGGFVVVKEEARDCDFGLGLNMVMMGSHQNQDGHDDESGEIVGGFSGDRVASAAGGSSGGATGVGGGGNMGSMFCSSTTNNQELTTTSMSSTMYDLVGGAADASSMQRSSLHPSSFKSCGALMGLGGGTMARLFTASQRQELDRQTIIYRHIAASMPIPPELLIPINCKYPSQLSLPPYQSNDHGTGGGKNALDLRHTVGSRDLEPWRCRRTDGKKWRCSRDVAPDQKYCERHSHKGRPSRSRKHVESSISSFSSSSSISSARFNNNNNNNNNNALVPSSTSSAINIKPSFLYPTSSTMFPSQNHQDPSQYTNSRFPEWFMDREAHHDQATAAAPTAGPFFPQTELDQMAPTHSNSIRTSEFMGSNQTHTLLPRQFLDAWSVADKSNEITDKSAGFNSNLLTLSMAGGGMDSCNKANEQEEKWMGYLSPGGPLAEALCLGIVETDGGGNSRVSHGHGESGQGLGFTK